MHDLRVLQKLNAEAVAAAEKRERSAVQVETTERVRAERAELLARLAELDELDGV